MKLIKGLGLLSFLVVLSGSCFDPPEFPVVPQIEFDRLEFKPAPTPQDFDSLLLYITFRDGDGDLGLEANNFLHISDPYHINTYYQENNGQLTPLSTSSGTIQGIQYDLLEIPDPQRGPLVTFQTRKKPGYSSLPQEFHCADYLYLAGPAVPGQGGNDGTRLLIHADDVAVLTPEMAVVDTFYAPETGRAVYYQIRDTLYFTPNPYHNNIEVDFLVKEGGEYHEYDWSQLCGPTYDQRFPVLSDPGNSVEGTLRYAITSFGLRATFSIKPLKLRIKIRDRALNESNVVETHEFTLIQ